MAASETFKILDAEVHHRDWAEGQQAITRLAGVYEGELPSEYNKYFPKESPKHIVNMIRLAWDDLATSIGRLPEFRGEPLNQSNKEEKKVSKLEHIAHAYLRNSKPSGKLLMWETAWWLLASRAVMLVIPDHKTKMPRITVRDPKSAYPGVKELAGGQIIELSDIIFKYELDADVMQRMGLAVGTEEDSFGRTVTKKKGQVIEYIDDQQWLICSDGGTVKQIGRAHV